jgi:protein-disulfide isomerase
MNFRFSRAAAALLLLAFAAAPVAPAAADSFTPQQHKELEGIVHDYLLKHPEVMIEVLQSAEDKLKSDAHEHAAKALSDRRQELLSDPNSPVAGNPQGDVTLVEFFDYRCPYCKQVEPSLEALLGQDRQLRLVYKEFPVLGPASVTAARAALAARQQGKYDVFHRAMMSLKGQIDDAAVFKVAASVGLDTERLKRDMAAPEIDRILRDNQKLADALDISGTPGFVIGNEIVPGAISIDEMKALIEAARKQPG